MLVLLSPASPHLDMVLRGAQGSILWDHRGTVTEGVVTYLRPHAPCKPMVQRQQVVASWVFVSAREIPFIALYSVYFRVLPFWTYPACVYCAASVFSYVGFLVVFVVDVVLFFLVGGLIDGFLVFHLL